MKYIQNFTSKTCILGSMNIQSSIDKGHCGNIFFESDQVRNDGKGSSSCRTKNL